MSKLKNWLINKLGGYTAKEFNRMCYAVREQDKAIERLVLEREAKYEKA